LYWARPGGGPQQEDADGMGKFDARCRKFGAHTSFVAATMDDPTDAELVAAATGGDVAAFAVLLERHRAGMRAVALSLLGWGPDAEDVVQDAMLVALQRLSDLRDPTAAGPWLRAITRNTARMRRRSSGRETPVDLLGHDRAALELTPEGDLEIHALNNWLWTAINALSERLQIPVLLRYFTAVGSYQEIALVCDLPVGTVRSRLHEARRKLGQALQACAAGVHDDAASLTESRRHEADDLLSAAERGEVHSALAAAAVPDLALTGPQGQRARGRAALADIMMGDVEAGVRQRLIQVTASCRVTILESALISPAWDPGHCPPGVLWLMTVNDSRIRSVRLFHPSVQAAN
jgi:RNA polymerase sigma factor (sigma-70 family)